MLAGRSIFTWQQHSAVQKLVITINSHGIAFAREPFDSVADHSNRIERQRLQCTSISRRVNRSPRVKAVRPSRRASLRYDIKNDGKHLCVYIASVRDVQTRPLPAERRS
jgi:hypothetical protein